jgi:ABC-2 type transport system ATP-binding protein
MNKFALSHQNPSSGLFLEPTIDANYRAIDSINFSSPEYQSSSLINPLRNNYTNGNLNFFLDYLFEKQNSDGSFSDVGGLGDMYSTFQVISIIDVLNSSYINPIIHREKINRIIDFVNNSMEEDGYGFRSSKYANQSDVISTYCAIKLVKRFNVYSLIENENITTYLDILRTLGSGKYVYSLTLPDATAESNYYGIRAHLALNNSYSEAELIIFESFFKSLYKPNGGYSNRLIDYANVESTYYSLSTLFKLNRFVTNQNDTYNFLLNCSNSDGGFGFRIGENFTSTFRNGWAALNSIKLLTQNGSLNYNIHETESAYYKWLSDNQAKNSLFGEISLESNYLGVLSLYNLDTQNFIYDIKERNISNYIDRCFNAFEGGYASKPGENSSLFSTYCAIKLHQMLYPHLNKWLINPNKTTEYVASLQNVDGGFKVGHDRNYTASLYGPYQQLVLNLINTNISVVESTYWALTSLNILNGLEEINNTALSRWIAAAQNADGGFSLILGFHSDTISTYYGLEIFKILKEPPLSKMAALEFLMKAQDESGGFNVIPLLSGFVETPTVFLATYLGSKAIYDYQKQPLDMENLVLFYDDCYSEKTGGIGDLTQFGADLHNTPFGIDILSFIRYNRSIDPTAWNQLLLNLILIELAIFGVIFLLSIASILNEKVRKLVKTKLGIGNKFNIDYLKKFPAIYCENLNIFAGRKLIVDSVSLELGHGKILGVLGESGAGKSTFVKALLGMRKYKGICNVYGMDSKKNKRKFRPLYGYVPQDLGKIYDDFTTMDNLISFGKQYGLSEKEIVRKGKRILRNLEIEDKANELVKNLSGGQKRRVSIAISLIHTPIFCILDEPTSGLDPIIRIKLWDNLMNINEKFNMTLIVITHYPEESRYCHKVVIFGRDRGMVEFGTPRDLLSYLPGEGRSIEITFIKPQPDALRRLEQMNGIEKALENRAGTDFTLLSDLNLTQIKKRIKDEFGEDNIKTFQQTDSKMESLFRYKAMEVPKLER